MVSFSYPKVLYMINDSFLHIMRCLVLDCLLDIPQYTMAFPFKTLRLRKFQIQVGFNRQSVSITQSQRIHSAAAVKNLFTAN
jgi:hypothetical protein